MSEILNIKAAMEMVGDDKDLYNDLLYSFITSIPFDTNHLKELEAKDDKEAAAKYVHLLKGASLQIGAERLGENAKKLENILRGKESGTIDDIKSLTEKLESEYNLTIAAIKDYRK
ncbi:MAG: Hpt domain-containing protein [Treponema sp.]|nr:Hpt domain-containing protein [Treponema sp.]